MKKFYFILLLSFSGNFLFAQTPGGVSSQLKLWLKADTATTTTASKVNSWAYANDNTKSFTAAVGNEPTLTNSGINFQPVVTFSGAQMMDGPIGPNAPVTAGNDAYSMFGVWMSTTNAGGTVQRIWSQRTSPGPDNTGDGFALATIAGNYGDQIEYPPYTHTIQQPFNANAWYISQLNLLNQATNDLNIYDNTNLIGGPLQLNTDPNGSPNGAALRTLSDQLNRIGAKNTNTDEALNGNIAELIVYDRPITGTEQLQVFTYLAIKYGIPILTNYVNSAGGVIWDATANSAYNTSVFGIGRDDASRLNVTQSNSIVTGSGNGTGQSGKGNIVLSNPSGLTSDQNYLLIGNNNAALTETTTNLPAAAAGSKRLNRQWKAAETGNVGTFNLSFDFTGITTTAAIGSGDFRLIVDIDGDGDFTTGYTRYYSPTSWSGNVANFNGIVLNNNEVFTIVTSATTALPVKWKSFNLKVENKNTIHLYWSVANNDKAKSYVVEHSYDGVTFNTISTVDNNVNVTNYDYADKNQSTGKHYYRIHQFDLDGKSYYSSIINVTLSNKDLVIILKNNPVHSSVEFELQSANSGNALIQLWSMNGNKVIETQQRITSGSNTINIPVEKAAPGNYLLKIMLADKVNVIRIMKY